MAGEPAAPRRGRPHLRLRLLRGRVGGGRTTTGRLEGGNTYVPPDTDDGTASVLSPTSLAPTVCGRALLVIARGVIIVSRVSRGEVYDRCCGHVKFEERPAPSRAPRGQARGRAAGPRPAAGRRPLTKVCVTPSSHPHRPWLFGQQPLRVKYVACPLVGGLGGELSWCFRKSQKQLQTCRRDSEVTLMGVSNAPKMTF